MASLFSVERGGSQTLWINRQAAIEFHNWTWGAAAYAAPSSFG